jgi:transcriptional antiterminator RfaH
MLRWYLIHTKPLGEVAAQLNLERQAYEVYFPRLLQNVRWRGSWRQRTAPLFPRYLFLRLDEGRQSMSPVRSTVGVASVVRFGSSFKVVPDEVIRDLRAREDPTTGCHRLSRRPALVPGAEVIVASGPFCGLGAVFECESGGGRVVVLLKLLGRDVPVRVPADLILQSHAT